MLCFYCTQTHTKLHCELSREFFKTIFARLPPLASAARCGPHPPQPLATPRGHDEKARRNVRGMAECEARSSPRACHTGPGKRFAPHQGAGEPDINIHKNTTAAERRTTTYNITEKSYR